MTSTSSHKPSTHLGRRASVAAAPYTIPSKGPQGHHGHSHSTSVTSSPFSPPSNVHIPQHMSQHQQQQAQNSTHHNHNHNHNQQQQLSSSVPLLSREFVVRRISEGESGRLKEELKCEACGKGYKHISSLAKHLWEHTPEWNMTKKLLISKHQQVQLLEAASILVGMNEINGNNSPKLGSISEENGHPHRHQENSSSFAIENDDLENIKFRKGSISQYPPSMNTFSSPAKYDVNNGGFLDVPKNKVLNSESAKGENSSNTSSPDDSSKLKENDDDNNDNDDDDSGVFGEMD